MKNILKQIFKSKLWLFPLGYFLYFLMDPLQCWHKPPARISTYFLHLLLVFTNFGILFLASVILSFKKADGWKNVIRFKTHSHWIVILVSLPLIFYLESIQPNADTVYQKNLLLMKQKLQRNPNAFSECIKQAVPISDGGKIGVCNRLELEIGDLPLIFTLVYDSSDQIVIDESRRTRPWFFAARATGGNFGALGFDMPTRLYGHFYYIEFRPYTEQNMTLYYPDPDN